MEVFVARQPIFDLKKNVIAYELLFRSGLDNFYDTELDVFLDTLISWVAAAQEDDGYLYTYRTILGDEADTAWVGKKRWEKTHLQCPRVILKLSPRGFRVGLIKR